MQQLQWHSDLTRVIDDWAQFNKKRHIVISPDIDGLTSAVILNSMYPVKIIGIYTTTHLLLLDDHSKEEAKDALWLDHDINHIGIRCIGQHLVLHQSTDNLPLRDKRSWNPNVWVGQAWSESFKGVAGRKRDKYPYGTANFLWDLKHRGTSPSPEQTAVLAHADGTWFALDCYKANGQIWKKLMFNESAWVDKLLNYRNEYKAHSVHKKFSDSLVDIGYKSQSRSPKAHLLPNKLKSLVGKQSLTIQIKSDATRYLDRIQQGLKIIGGHMGSNPTIGSRPNGLLSGERKLVYPNRINNFDELMVEEQIFSHAFTDFRSLSYTVNLKL